MQTYPYLVSTVCDAHKAPVLLSLQLLCMHFEAESSSQMIPFQTHARTDERAHFRSVPGKKRYEGVEIL